MQDENYKSADKEKIQKSYFLKPFSFYLLASFELIVLYITVSLLDPWGYFPELLQAALCILILGLILTWLVRGYLYRAAARRDVKDLFLILALSLCAAFAAALLAHFKPFESDIERRLETAFLPPFIFKREEIAFQVKIIPPAYTKYKSQEKKYPFVKEKKTAELFEEPSKKPDGFIMPPEDKIIARSINPIAQGSQILISLQNSKYLPILNIGNEKIPFSRKGGGFIVQAKIGKAANWGITLGSKVIASFPIVLIEDYRPEIANFMMLPALVKDHSGFRITLSDDYNIHSSYIVVSQKNNKNSEKYNIPLQRVKTFDDVLYVNLTSSSFTGEKVNIDLYVKDEAGNENRASIKDIELALKEFQNSSAKLIAEIRRDLIDKPHGYLTYANEIKALSLSEGLSQGLGKSRVLYHMALRSAYWRLRGSIEDIGRRDIKLRQKREKELKSAGNLLWDVAVLLEEGGSFEKKIPLIKSLEQVKLSLIRKEGLLLVRDKLLTVHRSYIQYLRSKINANYSKEHVTAEIKILREIYNKIIKKVHESRYIEALRLSDGLLMGAIKASENKKAT